MRAEIVQQPAVKDERWTHGLLAAQNLDGGWGYREGQDSAIEPTSWALLAISEMGREHSLDREKRAGASFLGRNQLSNGSWPTVPKDRAGSWVTSLACLALQGLGGWAPQVDAGLHWLARNWPGEGGFWWCLRHRLFGQPQLVVQDHRLRGWGWTRGTSSWVEPTAYALLALRAARGSTSFLARVDHRCRLAQAMLCNRMCAGGGWNCGNPVVYGAAGHPLLSSTCWALLSLGEFMDQADVRRCVTESLDWLERSYSQSPGPGSLALGALCLKAFRRAPPTVGPALSELYERNRFLGQVPVLAWASLAVQSVPRWLRPAIPAST